jgi:hypothetical protein
VDYLDEVQSLACQIVVDNFTQLLNWQRFSLSDSLTSGT